MDLLGVRLSGRFWSRRGKMRIDLTRRFVMSSQMRMDGNKRDSFSPQRKHKKNFWGKCMNLRRLTRELWLMSMLMEPELRVILIKRLKKEIFVMSKNFNEILIHFSAGDPQELTAISNVMCNTPSRKEPLLIGSVKSNLGTNSNKLNFFDSCTWITLGFTWARLY